MRRFRTGDPLSARRSRNENKIKKKENRISKISILKIRNKYFLFLKRQYRLFFSCTKAKH